LDSGKVRITELTVAIVETFSSFVLGFELGIGHWDNHKLLGFPILKEGKEEGNGDDIKDEEERKKLIINKRVEETNLQDEMK
jgi:hypothetical protein